MDAAELRKARDEILAVHVDAENRNDVDAVIATFKHPSYELVPVGEIFDGETEVRRYYREKEARGRRRYEVVKAYHADEAVIVEIRTLSLEPRPPYRVDLPEHRGLRVRRRGPHVRARVLRRRRLRRAGRRLTSVRRQR